MGTRSLRVCAEVIEELRGDRKIMEFALEGLAATDVPLGLGLHVRLLSGRCCDQIFYIGKPAKNQLQPEGRNRRGETQLRGPEVSGPLKGPWKAFQGPRRGVSVFNGAGKEGGPLRGP